MLLILAYVPQRSLPPISHQVVVQLLVLLAMRSSQLAMVSAPLLLAQPIVKDVPVQQQHVLCALLDHILLRQLAIQPAIILSQLSY